MQSEIHSRVNVRKLHENEGKVISWTSFENFWVLREGEFEKCFWGKSAGKSEFNVKLFGSFCNL